MSNNKDDFKESLSSLMFDDRLAEESDYQAPAFEASHTQQLIDKLQHLSRFGNLLTLVLGERGCGKSYLLEQLIEVIHDESDICHIMAQPLLTTAQLFQDIQADFLAETGTAIDNDTFQNLLDEIDAPHVNRVLIIDDADTLSADVLASLCQLSADEQDKDSPFLKIILFANHDLNLSIESAAMGVLPDTGIYTLDIPGLSQEDAYNWINFVLQQQGYDAEQDEIESLVEEGGDSLIDLERLALDFVQEAEQETFVEQAVEQPTVSLMGYWFGGLTIVVLAVLGAFFYQDELAELIFPEEPLPTPTVVEEAISVSEPLVEQITPEAEVDISPEPEALEAAEPGSDTDLATPELVDELVLKQNSQPIVVDETDSDTVVATDASSVMEDIVESTEEELSDADLTKDASAARIEPQITEPEAQQPVASVYTDMELRLLDLPDSDYVVQIIGLTKSDAIDRLISDHPDLDLVFYRSLLNEKPWQIIVLTGFSSYSDANQQRSDLPESLAVNKPWIKSIAKVKEEIRAAVE